MKSRVVILTIVAFCFFSATVTRPFVGLAIRVGLFYTTYKFVDGIVEGSISEFVNKYIDGPVDAICSFGKGVEAFGTGVRYTVIAFYNNKTGNAFSAAWENIKEYFDNAISVSQKEWEGRRKIAMQRKIKQKEVRPPADQFRKQRKVMKKKEPGELNVEKVGFVVKK